MNILLCCLLALFLDTLLQEFLYDDKVVLPPELFWRMFGGLRVEQELWIDLNLWQYGILGQVQLGNNDRIIFEVSSTKLRPNWLHSATRTATSLIDLNKHVLRPVHCHLLEVLDCELHNSRF